MKDSFIIFTESRELVDELNDGQKAALLDALFAYANDEEVVFPDAMTRIVFLAMRQKIDVANQRYEEKCARNRENGAKGGRKPNGSEKTERFPEKPNGSEKTLPDPDPEPDNDPEPDDKRKAPSEPKEKRPRFVPPTVEEVEAYAREAGLTMDCKRFHDHFTSNGWKVGGKAPMKDWKASVRNWARNDGKYGPRASARDDPPDTGGKYSAWLNSQDYSALLGGRR